MSSRFVVLCSLLLSGLCVCLVNAADHDVSGNIDGFRDLQFGMTKKAVEALDACSTSSECLYEMIGKNRYLSLTYDGLGATELDDFSSSHDQSSVRLSRITISMGRYNEEEYLTLQRILSEHYTLTQDISEDSLKAFDAGQQPALVQGYNNGQVLLKIVRRKFGNLVMNVVYQHLRLGTQSKIPSATLPVTP